MTGGSASAFGFGAGGARSLNNSSGFSESGFAETIRRELARLFPTPSAGGVVCILDNLELLGTSEAARHSLETIRSALLEVPSIRWVFVGSKGIITSARSRQLSGFIDSPIRLLPLTIDESVELVARRLAYWGTNKAHPPVQPEDFRHLYKILGTNLRDSLSIAQQFAKHYCSELVVAGLDLPSDSERPLYFQAWLADQADAALAEASGISPEAWDLFDGMCAAAGVVSVEAGDSDLLARLAPLQAFQLVDLEADPAQASARIGTVTAHGWLCASARPRAALVDMRSGQDPTATASEDPAQPASSTSEVPDLPSSEVLAEPIPANAPTGGGGEDLTAPVSSQGAGLAADGPTPLTSVDRKPLRTTASGCSGADEKMARRGHLFRSR